MLPPDLILRMLFASWDIGNSAVGEGGVTTGAESSDDISDDMLWRSRKVDERMEKKRRVRADFGGGVGGASSDVPRAGEEVEGFDACPEGEGVRERPRDGVWKSDGAREGDFCETSS